MSILSLAWRNLLRNRRRSLMTLMAMVLGIVAVLLFGGYVRDINYGMQSDYVRSSGHLQIQREGYFRLGTGNPAEFGIVNYERVIAAIKQDPVIAPLLTVVTPTLQFGAIAGNFSASVSRTVFVSGVVVEDQNRMRVWNDYQQLILSPLLPLSGTTADTAVIGTGVARVLQLCDKLALQNCESAPAKAESTGPELAADISALVMQDRPQASASPDAGSPRIEVLAANARGAPNVAAVRVLRAEAQALKEFDDVHVGLHLSQAQKLMFGAGAPQVTAIMVQLQHTAQLPAARQRLEELLNTTFKDEPLEVLDYETLNPFYGQAMSMFAAIFSFISVLIGAIVLFTVTNTMSMAVVERTVEIGTLRAIGLRRRAIRTMFVLEGFVLGCFGAVIGICVAFGLAWFINQLVITWISPGRVDPVPLAVRMSGEYGMLLSCAAGLIILAALSAILPAARAARMNIVDALRHA